MICLRGCCKDVSCINQSTHILSVRYVLLQDDAGLFTHYDTHYLRSECVALNLGAKHFARNFQLISKQYYCIR
jgi:hypothetical protein